MRVARLAAVALLTFAVSAAIPGTSSAAAPGVPPPGLPWLHVAHPSDGSRPVLADPAGRTVLLRGVNVGGLIDYWTGAVDNKPPFPIDSAAYIGACPQNFVAVEAPPLCEVDPGAGPPGVPADTSQDDLAQMRANGVDMVRLALSWSLLEPQPGVYDKTYVARIAQVVGWARQQGIYVLLDMHQDAYSRYIAGATVPTLPPLIASPRGYDGAPRWAVVTDGTPVFAAGGVREFDPAVQWAFTNFWLNRGLAYPRGQAPGTGLQDHYIGAIAALARRFHDDSTVVGYEVMNEPSPGFLPFGTMETGYLYPFYRRVIDAITGAGDGLPCPASTPAVAACGYPDLGIHDTRHAFFVEPDAVRNFVDVSTQVSIPFTSYPNVVFAPHVYTHVFTLDAETHLPPVFPVSYDQALVTADAEARAMHAALLVTEFGDNPAADGTVLRNQVAAQDRAQVGATLWIWKENCNDANPDSSWGMYGGGQPKACAAGGFAALSQNGALRPLRLRLLDRAWPRAVAGQLISYTYDPDTGEFAMHASATTAVQPGSPAAETVVYVPRTDAGVVTVGGAAVLDTVVTNADGSRLAYVAPSGGAYRVTVSAATLMSPGPATTPSPVAVPAPVQLPNTAPVDGGRPGGLLGVLTTATLLGWVRRGRLRRARGAVV